MGSSIPPVLQGDATPYIRRIAIVFLYGCDLESPLRHYLDDFAAWEKTHPQDAIILCGGPTQQKEFSGRTEAGVAYQYLFPSIHPHHRPEWFLERRSFTTFENARGAARIIAELKARKWSGTGPRHDEITIWCEATRGLKVAMLARHFLGFPPERAEPQIRIKVDSWELAHPTTMLVGTIKDWFVISFPRLCSFLEKSHSWYRRLIRAKRI